MVLPEVNSCRLLIKFLSLRPVIVMGLEHVPQAWLWLFKSLWDGLEFCFGWFLTVVVVAVSLVASCIGIVLTEGAVAAPPLA